MSRSGVAWQLRRWLCKAAKEVPSLQHRRISPHTFRHTILQGGVAPEVIALWLGHESLNTTHLYVEADLELKRHTLDKLPPHDQSDWPQNHRTSCYTFSTNCNYVELILRVTGQNPHRHWPQRRETLQLSA